MPHRVGLHRSRVRALDGALLLLAAMLSASGPHGPTGPAAGSETSATAPGRAGDSLRFRLGDRGEFLFDTGTLQGKLRADGKSLGLSSVVHKATQRPISRAHGLFGHYRVFTTNHRFGTAAWDWPSAARLRDDGAVEVHWPAHDARPFELRAVYRWSAANVLDLETTVAATRDLPDFEVFLASYFAESFSRCDLYVRDDSRAGRPPTLLAADRSRGDWQMAPRDELAATTTRDGRWSIAPHPVTWSLLPAFAEPLAARREAGGSLAAVLMAPREDCFAVATPYQTEGHFALYLSLFGRTIPAGEPAKSRARLEILDEADDRRIVDCHRAYLGRH